jgi:hypothetical protein
VLKHAGWRWLIAGFEQADWVKNLCTAGWCLLIHDRHEELVAMVEVEDLATRAPILQAYLKRAPGSSRGFAIKP